MRQKEECDFFLPGEKKAEGHLITVFQYLKSGYKEGGWSQFTRSHMEKTRGYTKELHQEKL